MQYANGVRGIYECGAGAPDQPEVAKWWGKCRMGAHGTEGFAEVLTNGGWRAVTRSGGSQSRRRRDELRPRHATLRSGHGRLAGRQPKPHPCRFESACQGAEIMLAMQQSAVFGGQIPLPLTIGMDEQAALKEVLAARKVLVSCEVNAKEYNV